MFRSNILDIYRYLALLSMRMYSLNIGFYKIVEQLRRNREGNGFKLSGYCMGSNVNSSCYADDSSLSLLLRWFSSQKKPCFNTCAMHRHLRRR